AYAKLGLTVGSTTATLSPNRPEVLFVMGANMVTGCRSSALHPMGSLDDHAYVLGDAGVTTLVFDPRFGQRAADLAERVPGLVTMLSLGPSEFGTDLVDLAASFTPKPLQAPVVAAEDVGGLTYTGGTTGKPKGVMGTYRSAAAMTTIQLTEWQWPAQTRFL
nr:AMP-binding protein [Micromonospora sp. DSM 115978]